ncbi:acyl carrier protein [Ramlibacter sp.]|uniref:acyl carrier protein n=1 Tax=Ramlibacter sp. TaxID=1917967 RepID=UPI001807CDEA|nr:acyl carrier protein [Ramlibacter sp.]MBA2672295.1 acyl carrier protein [Ramlibacter sp.]
MPEPSLIARLQGAAPPLRSSILVDHVISGLCKALHLDSPALVNGRSRFAELGIDSRRALELKEDLEEELGCALPTTLFFNYPTPERLAAYVIDQALGLGTATPATGADAASVAAAAQADPADADDIDAQMRSTFAKYGV